MDNIITSVCPVINQLVENDYPDMIPFMAPVGQSGHRPWEASKGRVWVILLKLYQLVHAWRKLLRIKKIPGQKATLTQ